MKEISPSILSADFYDLSKVFDELKKENVKYVHLDVMDGIFVPNITFGMPVIKAIKNKTLDSFILDTHLMITNPERYIEDFKNAGVDICTIHVEATKDLLGTIKKIKEKGMKAGISVNPETDIHSIDSVLPYVDLVLIMSVHPGFSGQKFIPETLDKVSYIKAEKDKNHYKYIIEMDGGINADNIKEVISKGVELFVAGNAVFKGDISANIEKFKSLV